ncbi:unnamed protein product, partial [Prorocentrum cordatum]
MLADPAKFEEWASNLFRQGADRRRAAIDLARQSGRLPPPQARAQSQSQHRKIQLWNPISKRSVLTRAKTSVGAVTGPAERLQEFVERWQPVFQGKNADAAKAESYLDHFASKIDFHRCKPPDYDALKRLASSFAARLIHHRNFGHNIFELDVESGIASADPDAMAKLPVLASLDIAQAFPSFAHQFIRPALKATGVPGALLNIFDAVCHDVLAMAPCASKCIPLCIRSGIVQGCGWSGTLYAMGNACFLLDLEKTLELRGPVDDELALKLRDALIAISPFSQEFSICDRLTNLGPLLGPRATGSLIYA